MNTDPDSHADVALIGAGPVGLLLANLLAKRGIRVRVVEERNQALRNSMAIGITPPSLNILKELGLDRSFIARGIPVTTVKVFENGRPLGEPDRRLITDKRFTFVSAAMAYGPVTISSTVVVPAASLIVAFWSTVSPASLYRLH